MAERRFLVVRLGSLGDIVHTFPAVAALRETFPASEIIWLTHARYKTLVQSSGLASKIWSTETRSMSSLMKTIREIRDTSFDTAIDYQGLWKSASLPFLAGVKRRIGFSSESVREFGVPLLYTDRVRATSAHVADQNGELSKRAGAKNAVADFRLDPPPLQHEELSKVSLGRDLEKYVVLSPGGGWRSKCWPPERFDALCKKIFESLSLRCVVNYGPDEEDLASTLSAASDDAAPVLFNGDLGPLMSILRGAICVVGGDTGPLHLAVALGTPVVALFGPTNPARNGPYRNLSSSASAAQSSYRQDSQDVVLRAPNVVATHSRQGRTHPSMLELQVDVVFEAVHRIVEARK
ncbi:MAG TPA: glycosyltransferase family 9 protein [Candidatus Acidoferrum sp.]|jgi:lipopolysaccharide heptosyltransferase I|nr:glycosyltransferase family 9 protein [Candidatus Acidoferrum sp.]